MFKKLNFKVSTLFFMIASILLSAFAFYNHHMFKQNTYQQLESTAQSALNRLSKNLPEALWNYMEEGYTRLIETEMTAKEIQAIIVQADDGVMIAKVQGEQGPVNAVEHSIAQRKNF